MARGMIEGSGGRCILDFDLVPFPKSFSINYGYEESCGPYIISFESQGILEEIPYANA